MSMVSRLLAVSFLLVLNSCGSDNSGSGGSGGFSQVWSSAFSGKCGTCHNGSSDSGPNLSTEAAFYSATVGKSIGTYYPDYVDEIGSGCEDFKLVATGNAGASLLAATVIESVADSFNSSCTPSYSQHKASNVTITDQATIDLVINWINDGANP